MIEGRFSVTEHKLSKVTEAPDQKGSYILAFYCGYRAGLELTPEQFQEYMHSIGGWYSVVKTPDGTADIVKVKSE